MGLLTRERETLAEYMPGLDEKLSAIPLTESERPGNPGIAFFKESGGPALLIPKENGGKGASPLDAVRIHRALGARSPSTAIVATMHNFSIATLVEFNVFGGGDESSLTLVAGVAEHNMLMASGFAEGRPGTNILAATMVARATPDGGWFISGSKKPCSISRSMDLLSASVIVPNPSGEGSRRAVILVPADAPGIERRPFWKSPVLAGAESDEVILHDVEIPGDFLFYPGVEEALDPVEIAGYLWFQLLVTASYLGAATQLVERVMASDRGGAVERAQLGVEVESAAAALECIAIAAATESKEKLLPRALLVRFAIQQAIERASMLAAEILGGMEFIGTTAVANLLATGRALAFHPPSRLASSASLANWLAGGDLGKV
jgi:alkylation response protein AidB-like acyl-CoA dehydrogenase